MPANDSQWQCRMTVSPWAKGHGAPHGDGRHRDQPSRLHGMLRGALLQKIKIQLLPRISWGIYAVQRVSAGSDVKAGRAADDAERLHPAGRGQVQRLAARLCRQLDGARGSCRWH